MVDKTIQIVERGPQGIPGNGVASGGTTGQILNKASDDDYDTVWADGPTNKAYFGVISYDTITIGTDPLNPTKFTGLANYIPPNGFELVSEFDAVRNISGRTLIGVDGTINIFPDKSGGGTTLIYLVSERSTDGITWIGNLESLRPIEISNSGESFQTKLSAASNWLHNEMIRFRVYAASGGDIDLVSQEHDLLGQTFTTFSVGWILKEL